MERVFTHELPWVGCQYPTPALAQDAGMSLAAFADFLFGACLLDWDAERERMQRYAERFDAAEEVRIVGPGTDLTLSLAGRRRRSTRAARTCPAASSSTRRSRTPPRGRSTSPSSRPSTAGREVTGIRLRFEGGRVVDASADAEEEFLLDTLDRDEGRAAAGRARDRLQPRHHAHMKNTLFDEKIDGTVHLALGNGLPEVGGTNVSPIHWDIVKDLRRAGASTSTARSCRRTGGASDSRASVPGA